MIIKTITRIPCYIIRKYATLAQVHELLKKLGHLLEKYKSFQVRYTIKLIIIQICLQQMVVTPRGHILI